MFKGFTLGTKKDTTKAVGDAAEDRALAHIEQHGLTLVARNFRCKCGEIDLILKDGDVLVFVEVRYRKRQDYGSALESVTASKQKKIHNSAQYYLQTKALGESQAIRFDVVAMSPNDIQWIQHAF
tara:strand:+ start:87 stop:461 length:375 start_codon:yes stop_codon:yes gene_type:complete